MFQRWWKMLSEFQFKFPYEMTPKPIKVDEPIPVCPVVAIAEKEAPKKNKGGRPRKKL